jgi:hypothetical protein
MWPAELAEELDRPVQGVDPDLLDVLDSAVQRLVKLAAALKMQAGWLFRG